jgi:hypothetical protein
METIIALSIIGFIPLCVLIALTSARRENKKRSSRPEYIWLDGGHPNATIKKQE